MTDLTPKRQPRGEEPMEQRSYKLPTRCVAHIQRKAQMAGITEAHALRNLIDRDIAHTPVFDDRAESEVA